MLLDGALGTDLDPLVAQARALLRVRHGAARHARRRQGGEQGPRADAGLRAVEVLDLLPALHVPLRGLPPLVALARQPGVLLRTRPLVVPVPPPLPRHMLVRRLEARSPHARGRRSAGLVRTSILLVRRPLHRRAPKGGGGGDGGGPGSSPPAHGAVCIAKKKKGGKAGGRATPPPPRPHVPRSGAACPTPPRPAKGAPRSQPQAVPLCPPSRAPCRTCPHWDASPAVWVASRGGRRAGGQRCGGCPKGCIFFFLAPPLLPSLALASGAVGCSRGQHAHAARTVARWALAPGGNVVRRRRRRRGGATTPCMYASSTCRLASSGTATMPGTGTLAVTRACTAGGHRGTS